MNPVGTLDTGVGTGLPGYPEKTNPEKQESPEERVREKNPDLERFKNDSTTEVWASLVAEEANNDIKFRTMSWQKTALLLFGE